MLPVLDGRSSTVPAFLNKLCTLLDDESTDDMICWDASGKSFHLLDQNRFAKEILPMYFKTSNISSFIRQLNMYGFKKVVHINSGIKYEKEDVEFQHPYFIRGKEELLERIKRKGVQPKMEEGTKVRENEDYSKICQNVKTLAKKHEVVNSQFEAIKRENVALWREIAILRQKHKVQQDILNNVIRFLLSMVGKRQMQSPKRKIPMITGPAIPAKQPRYEVKDDEVPSSIPKTEGDATIHDLPANDEETAISNFIQAIGTSSTSNIDNVKKPSKQTIEKADIYQNMDLIQNDFDIFKDLLSNSSLPFSAEHFDNPGNNDELNRDQATESNNEVNDTIENAVQKYPMSFPELDDLLNSSYNSSTNNELSEIFDIPLGTPSADQPPTEQVD